jgi:hypothetical protein
VQSIVPQGYYEDRWPKAMSGNQIAVSQVTATLAASETSIDNTHKQVAKQISAYAKFFVPHFGLDPLDSNQPQSLVSIYFPPNHTVKQGGGTGNTLSIAQELMGFQNPSAADVGMDIWPVVAILNGILRIPYQEEKTSALVDKQMESVEKAVFELEFRPTRDSMVAALGLKVWNTATNGVPTNVKTVKQMKMPISSYSLNSTAFIEPSSRVSGAVRVLKYNYSFRTAEGTNTLYGRWSTFGLERTHTKGFNISLTHTLNHYEEVYQVNNPATTPAMFWKANSRKRIGVEVDPGSGIQNYTVKIFNVDPATGAPRDRGIPVARAPISNYQGNPGLLLAKVREALFPEVYLLTDGISTDADARQEHYKEALLYAKNTWEGIQDKTRTPMTCVISQYYGPIPEPVTNANATETAKIYAAKIPKPGVGTMIPIQSMTMYLQPTGIEDAMRRILDINHPQNAIKKWFGTDVQGPLGDRTLASNDKTRYRNEIIGIQMADWNNIQDYTNKVIQTLYALLDSPHLYAEGINGATISANSGEDSKKDLANRAKLFGKTHPLALPKDPPVLTYVGKMTDLKPAVTREEYVKVLGGALRIMQLADWPQGSPEKMFDAPVDDEADLNMLMSMFKNYLNNETAIAPGQMYVPEGFNGMLVSEVVMGEGTSNIVWEFHKTVPAVSGTLAYRPSGMIEYYWIDTTPARSFSLTSPTTSVIRNSSWSFSRHVVNKISRYHQGAKTITTKRTVARTSPFSMPKPISPSATQLETYRDSSATQLFGQINASKGIIGATAGLGLMFYIYRSTWVPKIGK